MDKYLGFAWCIATVTSWISFGYASWEWAGSFTTGKLILTIFWFVMTLILFFIGLRLRKSSGN